MELPEEKKSIYKSRHSPWIIDRLCHKTSHSFLDSLWVFLSRQRRGFVADCRITPQRYHSESSPSCAAFPVYKNRKSLEQKGQVATTHLLLLIFPLPFTNYLETNRNAGASALDIPTAQNRMCFTALCAGIRLGCHLSSWSHVLLYSLPLLLVKVSPVLFLINLDLKADHVLLTSPSEWCLQPSQIYGTFINLTINHFMILC